MTTTDEAEARLRQIWDAVHVGPAPTIEKVLSADRARRRSRLAWTTAAAVAVVAATSIAVTMDPFDRVVPDASTSPSEAQPMSLPTSEWKQGDLSLEARASGLLTADPDQSCPYLERGSGPKIYLLWPAGYTARKTTDGTIEILDVTGTQVAKTGEILTLGGGYGTADHQLGCVPTGADIFSIQSDIKTGA